MIGYVVPRVEQLASYRLRVAIPAPHIGRPYQIGAIGNPSFFFKNGDPPLAKRVKEHGYGVVYDVVNDHFGGGVRDTYSGMCKVADVVTCASERMAEIIKERTGREAVIIDDPYENDEQPATCVGDGVLWFGHSANLPSLEPYVNLRGLTVCSNIAFVVPWSLENERRELDRCAVALLTSNNAGASSNRVVKALRAGRFVVTPGGVPAWEQFKPSIWIGDVREGIAWALNNREEACKKVRKGQKFVRERFSPQAIGKQWRTVFDSTSAAATNGQKGG